ncbi:MAG: hypothetical protein GVY25_08630 [Bacteroidetes bacterium]|jgi:preprotein translocase subunit SecB|nr:hypothetical protein [Bacteroidota bacterium]
MTRIDETGGILSPLQLIEYQVDSIEYNPAHKVSEGERDVEAVLDLSFLPDSRPGDSHGMSMYLELQDRDSESEEVDSASFRLSIKVTGHFEFIDPPSSRPDAETLRRFFFTTSVGTLYGIVREKVRSISSQSTSSGMILPMVNLGAIAEGLEEEEELEHFNFEGTSDEDAEES